MGGRRPNQQLKPDLPLSVPCPSWRVRTSTQGGTSFRLLAVTACRLASFGAMAADTSGGRSASRSNSSEKLVGVFMWPDDSRCVSQEGWVVALSRSYRGIVRVWELAEELRVESAHVLALIEPYDKYVRSHLSTVPELALRAIRADPPNPPNPSGPPVTSLSITPSNRRPSASGCIAATSHRRARRERHTSSRITLSARPSNESKPARSARAAQVRAATAQVRAATAQATVDSTPANWTGGPRCIRTRL
jgi:hypothetical protein